MNQGIFIALHLPSAISTAESPLLASVLFQVPILNLFFKQLKETDSPVGGKGNVWDPSSVVRRVKGNTESQILERKESRRLQDLSKKYILFL